MYDTWIRRSLSDSLAFSSFILSSNFSTRVDNMAFSWEELKVKFGFFLHIKPFNKDISDHIQCIIMMNGAVLRAGAHC